MIIFKNRSFFNGIRLILFGAMVIIIMLFTIGVLFYHNKAKKQFNSVQKNRDQSLMNSYKALYTLKSNYYNGIIIDYACYDWMIEYIKAPKQHKPSDNITAAKDLHLSVFQVFNTNNDIIYCDNPELIDNDTLLFSDFFFKELQNKRDLIFFQKYDTLLIEIHASTIQKSDDLEKKGPIKGFLIIGKIWNKKYIDEFSTITNSNMCIQILKKKTNKSIANTQVVPLKDFYKNTIATVSYKTTSLYTDAIILPKGFIELYSIILCLLVVIICVLVFEIFIMKPITKLNQSLSNEDFSPLLPIIIKENEFSGIALYVQEYFSQVQCAHEEIFEMQRTKDKLKETYDELLDLIEQASKQSLELEIQSDKLASANFEIQFKNNQLELQQLEITDSIKYASMIQNAVLLPQFNLEKTFSDHFIFFKPKEILSGDFYWFKEFYGKYYFACADCTGHGFSGAMMSMLGISFLNELTHHYNDKDTKPSIVLDKLRLKIVETLHQTGEIGQIRDGMDIILCMYDPETSKLEFASAYNVLYQINKKEDGSFELHEHKGDRMPVGIYDTTEPFTNHSINVKKGDTFYLVTDGYIDQFGGPNRKKINKQNVKNLLLSIQHLNLTEQRLYFKEFLKSWIGTLEQVDDITVVGIKI